MAAESCLTELDLSDNAFGPTGVEPIIPLLTSSSFYSIKVLKFNNNGLGIKGGTVSRKIWFWALYSTWPLNLWQRALWERENLSVKDTAPISLPQFVLIHFWVAQKRMVFLFYNDLVLCCCANFYLVFVQSTSEMPRRSSECGPEACAGDICGRKESAGERRR